jgi:hypothetical protein
MNYHQLPHYFSRRSYLTILVPLISMIFSVFGENLTSVYGQSLNSLASDQIATQSMSPADPFTVRVYVLEFMPSIEGTPLNVKRNWQDPNTLMVNFIREFQLATGGTVNYQLEIHVVTAQYPMKEQGFVYSSYMQYSACVANPKSADYCKRSLDYGVALTTQYDSSVPSACEAIESRQADEVWLWGGAWFFGDLEYYFVNTGKFCKHPTRPFTVMTFNYERGVPEMMHDLGHRTENYVRSHIGPVLWDAFDGQNQRYAELYDDPAAPDSVHPEVDATNTHCGNVHFPPNAFKHYQYLRDLAVQSDCDDWVNFPNLTGRKTTITRDSWGNTEIGYYRWWLGHIPRNAGWTANGFFNNWWRYVFPLI